VRKGQGPDSNSGLCLPGPVLLPCSKPYPSPETQGPLPWSSVCCLYWVTDSGRRRDQWDLVRTARKLLQWPGRLTNEAQRRCRQRSKEESGESDRTKVRILQAE
jgi:hypothetical protein